MIVGSIPGPELLMNINNTNIILNIVVKLIITNIILFAILRLLKGKYIFLFLIDYFVIITLK